MLLPVKLKAVSNSLNDRGLRLETKNRAFNINITIMMYYNVYLQSNICKTYSKYAIYIITLRVK